jgi:putative salt-induced outer membrane protein
MMFRTFISALLVFGISATATAEWTGLGELGVVAARGNTQTDTVNGRVELEFKRERWTNESIVTGVYSRDADETRASRLVLGNKTDYDITERSYLLGALRYDRDRFTDYRYQTTASVGYGHWFLDTERHRLRGEIGPGVRYAEFRESEETDTDFIVRGFLNYAWQISETAELKNRLLVESSTDNTFTENELSISVAINDRLALKAGLAVRHNSEVEPGTKNTDTLTTANLVYNFRRN